MYPYTTYADHARYIYKYTSSLPLNVTKTIATIICCHCFHRFSTPSDRWIGLHRSADYCTCASVSTEQCEACRASWSWSDGTNMTWSSWVPREPGSAKCGRLSATGWAEYDCSAHYRFICERGTCTVKKIAKFSLL